MCSQHTRAKNIEFFTRMPVQRYWLFKLITFYAILKLKSSDDILDGLNKLEDIAPISKF
jgi:hypothetical protein